MKTTQSWVVENGILEKLPVWFLLSWRYPFNTKKQVLDSLSGTKTYVCESQGFCISEASCVLFRERQVMRFHNNQILYFRWDPNSFMEICSWKIDPATANYPQCVCLAIKQ